HGAEEFGAVKGNPFSFFGRGRVRRHAPARGETAEMIQPDDVHVREQCADPANEPFVALAGKGFQIINRIPPELSRRAEVVGWHTAHKTRAAALVQKKQVRARPYIGRVGRDQEGKIADKPYTPEARVLFEVLRLTVEQKL